MTKEAKQSEYGTFLEYYVTVIRPQLMEIDLLIKTSCKRLPVSEAANALCLTNDEVKQIMQNQHIKAINRRNFFKIMEQGSSNICKLFKREVESGSPHIYSRENISYIYGLELSEVNKVCDKLKIKEITPFTLPDVFSEIHVH